MFISFTTDNITQHRGIRQGDPISPLLFNIAFDPSNKILNSTVLNFLLLTEESISVAPPLDSLSQLFYDRSEDMQPSTTQAPTVSPALLSTSSVEILAYDADDTLVFLRDTNGFYILQQFITRYTHASNALLNYHKTVATSLSGKPSIPCWVTFIEDDSITDFLVPLSPT